MIIIPRIHTLTALTIALTGFGLSLPAMADAPTMRVNTNPDTTSGILAHSPPSRNLGNALKVKMSAADDAEPQTSILRGFASSPHLSAPHPVKLAEAQTSAQENTMPASPSDLHSAFDDILAKYVSAPDAAGLTHFDYAALKGASADYATLAEYISLLSKQDPDALPPNDAVPYWANLYNAVTLKVVTENYPVTSIKEIKSGLFTSGPWKKKLVTVNGKALSLDDIEHGILRERYASPLIHYMVNCASVGCPNLRSSAWRADTYKAQRKDAARAYINSPRGAVITNDGLKVSSIYDWFEKDFGGSKASVLKHLREYADTDLAAAIDNGVKINGYAYDWALNK